jgi:hypothetical protein
MVGVAEHPEIGAPNEILEIAMKQGFSGSDLNLGAMARGVGEWCVTTTVNPSWSFAGSAPIKALVRSKAAAACSGIHERPPVSMLLASVFASP